MYNLLNYLKYTNRNMPFYDKEYVAFSPFDKRALDGLIKSIDKPHKVCLEIGSWMGNGSTNIFVDNLLQNNGLLYCVDTWRGNPNVTKHIEIVSKYDVFGTFMKNVKAYEGEDIVKPMLMSSSDAASIFADKSLDIVFIDADHGYNAVRKDIDLWREKISEGGILCGHDCEFHPGDKDYEMLNSNRHLDTIECDSKFTRIHPGSILAVHEAFGDEVNLCSDDIITLNTGQKGYSSIWYVKY